MNSRSGRSSRKNKPETAWKLMPEDMPPPDVLLGDEARELWIKQYSRICRKTT